MLIDDQTVPNVQNNVGSKLVEHLTRCDTTVLIEQLGDATLKLLERMGSDAVTPNGLAELVVYAYGEEGVLRNSRIRKLLFAKLTPDEGAHLCSILTLPTYAPSVTLAGADFENDRSNADLLFRYFNVYAEQEPILVESTQNSAASHQLREHQADAYRKLRRLISDPTAAALVHMPFGAGKLRTVATAMLDLYRAEPDGRVVVWLTSGEALCEEVFAELNAVWLQLGSRNVTAYRLYGSHPIPDLNNIKNGIVVADIDRIVGNSGLVSLGRRTRVVVLGDAESLKLGKVSALLEVMSQEAEFSLIGISASSADVIKARATLSAIAARFAGFCISIEDGDPIGLLQRLGDIDRVIVEVKDIASPTLDGVDFSGIDIPQNIVELISKDVDRNHAILDLVLEEAKLTTGTVVLYAATAENARLFAGLLRLRGTRATAITSEMSRFQIEQALQKHVSRLERVLCTHGVFVSGEDLPQTSTAVVSVPTTSGTVLHEIVGRLASGRNNPESPLKFVFLGDNIPDYLILARGLETWEALEI